MLERLDIAHFRNLANQRLEFAPVLNIFYGPNGSGKTSILEAIYVLSLNKSFRSAKLEHLVQHGQDHYILGAQLGTEPKIQAGKTYHLHGKTEFILSHKPSSALGLAQALPVQILSTSSHLLVDGPSEHRRKFLDWSLFHLVPEFALNLQTFRKALAARAALLKQKLSYAELRGQIAAWQQIFIDSALAIDRARKEFVFLLSGALAEFPFLDGFEIALSYEPGWPENESLELCLERSLAYDLAAGHSHYGPHRADLLIQINGAEAKHILSRGQQKLLVAALVLARTSLLAKLKQKRSIFLLDDLSAELDARASALLLNGLLALGTQIFVSNIEKAAVLTHLSQDLDLKLFSIAAGKIDSRSILGS